MSIFNYVPMFLPEAGNPVNRLDPLGLFMDHATLSIAAFNTENCGKLASDATKWANLVDYQDNTNDPKYAYWHAMRNGDVNESVESAISKTKKHIHSKLGECNAESLGWALHAEQDKYAGGHRGYQPGYTHSNRLEHWKKDAFGRGHDEAIAASVQLIKKFKEMCPCACGE